MYYRLQITVSRRAKDSGGNEKGLEIRNEKAGLAVIADSAFLFASDILLRAEVDDQKMREVRAFAG